MLRAETAALLRRARSRALFVLLFAFPVFLAIAVSISGGPPNGAGPTFLDRASHSGVFTALAGLVVMMPFFIPLSVSIVAGDAIAGEASMGTLRYLLVRPSGRGRLLAVKAVVVAGFCLAAALIVVVAGLLAGVVLFAHGPVVTLSGTTIPFLDGVGRALLSAVVVGASMWGLAAIGLFISTVTDVPIAAMAITLGIVIFSAILDSISQVDFLHPWLLTNYWTAFTDLARDPMRWHLVWKDIVLQVGYMAVFGAGAWARMVTRDVLA